LKETQILRLLVEFFAENVQALLAMKPRKVYASPLGVPPRLRARHRPHRYCQRWRGWRPTALSAWATMMRASRT